MSERTTYNPDWPGLLTEALEMPGQMSDIYNRFKPGGYSFNNRVLLYLQGVAEPVNTFARWKEMGRWVKRGSKAKFIIRPIFRKEHDPETGQETQRLSGFKPVNCLFGVSETEGDDLPEYTPPEWSEERALGALGLQRVAFTLHDGDIQGVSWDDKVAVNPVAAEPFPTLLHEINHHVHGHTAKDKLAEYATHRGLFEFSAESSAYLELNDLGVDEPHWSKAESRSYVQSWLRGQQPDDSSIRQVFKVADQVLNAGRASDLSTEASGEAA